MSQVLLQQVDGAYDVSGEIARAYRAEQTVSSRCGGLESVGLHRRDVDRALRGVRPQHRAQLGPTRMDHPPLGRPPHSTTLLHTYPSELFTCTGRPRR
ncbi:hypothetical protein XF35_15120 [Streptomyces platensis subsp. clarensis]|nr:hypothetical protein [Streptomyces platensis subsp. clarensis]